MKNKLRRRNFMFSKKKNPQRGIMSTILGILSVIAIGLTVFSSFRLKGEPSARLGATMLMSLVFSITGITLGILSRFEQDMFYFFSNLGIILNAVAILAIGFILYAGVFGL